MRKIFTVLTIILASTTLLCAQDSKFSVGVKAGMNLSKWNAEYYDTKTRVGYRFGVVGEYQLPSNFFLQSSLEFLSKGSKNDFHLSFKDDEGNEIYADESLKWNQTYLELPILIGYEINATEDLKVRITAGPYLAVGVGGKVKAENMVLTNEDGVYEKDKFDSFSDSTLKRFDMGLLGAVGVEYKKIQLSVGYEYGLTDISRGMNSIHNMTGFVTLGYRIF